MAFFDQTGGLSGLPVKQERVFSIAPNEAGVDTSTPPRKLQRVVKVKSFPVDSSTLYSYTRGNFEDAPFDFERILKAYQTDSIVKMAMAKYRELIWKNGFELVSENPRARVYLQQRLDIMEVFMGKSFEQLLQEIADSLVLFHNAFLVKARNDLSEYVTGIRAEPQFDNSMPIVGFYQLPTHKTRIKRDKHNRVLAYQQQLDMGTGNKAPSWTASRVVHFALDMKPGTVFGEPFVENVLEDLLALRQLEEDVLNLTHRELFPMMIYKVGTDEARAEDGEVQEVKNELENMRTDSGLVIPWRHDITFEGGQGKALEAQEYLKYFRQRVIVGLGFSEIHLGMSDVANRSVSERLDVALYDKVKGYQRYLARAVQPIFNEILLEGGFNPYEVPAKEGDSDRVTMVFNEIDVETQVKRENNAVFKWVSNATTHEELRKELGQDPLEPEGEKRLYFNLIEAPLAVIGRALPPSDSTQKGTAQKSSPNQKKPSTTGALNRNQPQNQHKTRTSPRISHGLSLPSIEEAATVGDFVAGSSAIQIQEMRPVLYSWLFKQLENGIMRGSTALGELVAAPPTWRDEGRRAINGRLDKGIMRLEQTLENGGVMESVALEAFASEITALGERLEQAAELFTAIHASKEDICFETNSPSCGICSRITKEKIDKSFATLERVLSFVHLPCRLTIVAVDEEG